MAAASLGILGISRSYEPHVQGLRFPPLTRCFVLVVTLALSFSAVIANAGDGEVVLGKQYLRGKYDIGWGTAHPSVIDNGGVPSGKAWNLWWSNWGAASATAHGLTWLYRPNGGYYRKPGAIELRAYRLGRCEPGGKPAYTRLAGRVAVRPGGPLGRWFLWGGSGTICRTP
jgi:hypothetical protein